MKKQEINAVEKNAPPPRFHMEINGEHSGMAVLVYGVRHIEEYSRETLVLKISGGRMRLRGTGLSLSIFENKCMEIRGRLSEVGFSYDRT